MIREGYKYKCSPAAKLPRWTLCTLLYPRFGRLWKSKSFSCTLLFFIIVVQAITKPNIYLLNSACPQIGPSHRYNNIILPLWELKVHFMEKPLLLLFLERFYTIEDHRNTPIDRWMNENFNHIWWWCDICQIYPMRARWHLLYYYGDQVR